jgi:hypothetical protein
MKRIRWIFWGDPLFRAEVRVGQQERLLREELAATMKDLKDQLRTLGFECCHYTDANRPPSLENNSVVVTPGIDCLNQQVPVARNSWYLIVQPDVTFRVSGFPTDRTMVAARFRKTPLPTHLYRECLYVISLVRTFPQWVNS